MIILAFDTETTGLPGKPSTPLEKQPHIMQLAATLYDSERRPIQEFSTLIRIPEGIEPNPFAFNVHGITSTACNLFGLEKRTGLALLRHMAERADLCIAHNAQFDMQLLKFESLRCDTFHPILDSKVFCTCDAATPILNLPPTAKMQAVGMTSPKKAKLEECYRTFFNEELSGAHDALVDTRGCARVFFHMLDQKMIQPRMAP